MLDWMWSDLASSEGAGKLLRTPRCPGRPPANDWTHSVGGAQGETLPQCGAKGKKISVSTLEYSVAESKTRRTQAALRVRRVSSITPVESAGSFPKD